MSENSEERYRENRDLYWELLQDARKQADQQLVELIRARIARPNDNFPRKQNGCQIIHFATVIEHCADCRLQVRFWKENRFWHDFLFTISYLSIGLWWILYPFVWART